VFAREGKRVEGREADGARGTWVLSTKSRDRERGVEVVVRLPAVVARVISFPFDQVFDATIADAAVKDRLDIEFLFAVDKDWVGRRDGATAREGVVGSRSQFDDGEYRVEAAHGVREAKAVGVTTHAALDHIRAKVAIGELGRRAISVDVARV
jgi:hypothetical protein